VTPEKDPTGSPWTFAGSAGVAGNGSPVTWGNPPAPQGTQVAWEQNGGSISQSVTFAAGSYAISLDAAQRGNYPSHSTIQVQIDGQTVGSITPSGTSYALYTAGSFTVAAGSHTLQFVGVGVGGSTALLDQVSIAASGGTSPANPNLALSGTAYRWWDMATPTATTNQTAAPGLNNNDLQGNVVLSGTGLDGLGDDAPNAYEAAGVLWSTAQTLNTVVFINGTYTASQDGVFDANFGLQFTTDGTTWQNAVGWTLTPSYAYNSPQASGASYTFTGPATVKRGPLSNGLTARKVQWCWPHLKRAGAMVLGASETRHSRADRQSLPHGPSPGP
jgi:hypothetical protein